MTLHALLLISHLLAAAFWVGGMATLHGAVRPAVAAALSEPAQRLKVMLAVLQRFFIGVAIAIGVLLASGLAMILLGGGFALQPGRVHAMMTLGVVMMGLFGHIRFALYPRLQRGVAQSDWPAAGAALIRIRRLVGINLALGILVFSVALLGRA